MAHVYFDDEVDSEMQGSMPGTHAGVVSSSLQPRCCSITLTDKNVRDPAYIFRVLVNPDASTVVAPLSTNIIKVFGLSGSSLSHRGDLKGHTGTISGIQQVPNDGNLFYTSSADSTVRCWDMRQGKEVQSLQVPGHELLCVSCQSNLVAAGGQGEVFFWDRRTGTAMAKLEDTHMEDVTQVRFCPSSEQHVFSSSVDGLIAVHDTTKPLDDDDAFVAAVNLETSIEEIGTYGRENEKLWIRTGTETVHLWEWRRAAREDELGGERPFADMIDARQQATQTATAAGGSVAETFAQVSEDEGGVQYVAGCHYDAHSNQLMLMGGREGSLAFWPIHEQVCPSGSGVMAGASIGAPAMLLNGAHTAVVRSAALFGGGSQGVCCITGGEDARLCCWTLDPNIPSASNASGNASTALASGNSQASGAHIQNQGGVGKAGGGGGGRAKGGAGGKDKGSGKGKHTGNFMNRPSPY